jgi:hypothetical protein
MCRFVDGLEPERPDRDRLWREEVSIHASDERYRSLYPCEVLV